MSEPLDILGLTSAELAFEAARMLSAGAEASGRVYRDAFRTGALVESGSRPWREAFRVGLLEPVRTACEPGEAGITRKAVFRAADGAEFECVRIPMYGEGRATLCLSSQAGCRMGCVFCETGRSGLVRNLTAAEIVSQVVTARVLLGWECGNLVFMGMGEPLDNFENLSKALAALLDVRGLSFSQERVTVCTSGHVEGIRALRSLGYKRLGLAVSLNAGSDEVRNRLMPIGRRWGLQALSGALAEYPQRKNFALGVNYCLLPGVNDTRRDASLAARFCGGVGRCMVNLIPYNPGRAPIARAPFPRETERFLGWLREEGLQVRVRAAKGAGILAACGQLGGRG